MRCAHRRCTNSKIHKEPLSTSAVEIGHVVCVLSAQLCEHSGQFRAVGYSDQLSWIQFAVDTQNGATVFLCMQRPLFPDFSYRAQHIAARNVDAAIVFNNPSGARASGFQQLKLDGVVVLEQNASPVLSLTTSPLLKSAATHQPHGSIGEAGC